MAITKSAVSVLSAVTTTQTSAAIDCSGSYSQQLFVDVVQVGTATTAATFQPQWSPDGGTTYYVGPIYSIALTAGTYDYVIDVPVTATKVKLAFTTQAGGTSSTLTAQLGQVTGV